MEQIPLTETQDNLIFRMLSIFKDTPSAKELSDVKIGSHYKSKSESYYFISCKKPNGKWTFPIKERNGKLEVMSEFRVDARTVKSLVSKKILISKNNGFFLVGKYIYKEYIPNKFKTNNDKIFFNKYFSEKLNITLVNKERLEEAYKVLSNIVIDNKVNISQLNTYFSKLKKEFDVYRGIVVELDSMNSYDLGEIIENQYSFTTDKETAMDFIELESPNFEEPVGLLLRGKIVGISTLDMLEYLTRLGVEVSSKVINIIESENEIISIVSDVSIVTIEEIHVDELYFLGVKQSK